MIDALDEWPAEMPDVPFLPTAAVPPGVYVVVTSRPGDHLERLREQLSTIPSLTYVLPPLNVEEVRSFVSSRHATISDPQVEVLAAVSAGNPLYLDAALRETTDSGCFSRETLPKSVEGYFSRATRRARTREWSGM